MAGEAKLAAALGKLKLLRTRVRIVASDALTVFDGAVNAGLGEFRFLFYMAAITEVCSLKSQELGEFCRVRVVTTFTEAQLNRRVNGGLGKLLLEFGVALVAQLRALRLERHGRVSASRCHQ